VVELGGPGGRGQPSATSVVVELGGPGGRGQPSATSVVVELGGPGGRGQPSATSVVVELGGPGGRGQPSALKVRSIVTSLPAEGLPNPTIGSTINRAKAETATTISVFFKGVSLLKNRVRRDSFGEAECWKMFRMRNTRAE